MNKLFIAKALRLIVISYVVFFLYSIISGIQAPEYKVAKTKMTEAKEEQRQIEDSMRFRRSGGPIDTATGFQWAKQNNITSHEKCRSFWKSTDKNDPGRYVYQRSGCHDYAYLQNVNKFAVPRKPEDWPEDTTKAGCLYKTNLFITAVNHNMIARGSHPMTGRQMAQKLGGCNNLDYYRVERMVGKPLARLRWIQEKYNRGIALSDTDKKIIQQDYPKVKNFTPDHRDKSQYLSEIEAFFIQLGGRNEILPGSHSQE